MIAVVDYGVGNLYSLTCSLRHIGAQCTVTREENRAARGGPHHFAGRGGLWRCGGKIFMPSGWMRCCATLPDRASRSWASALACSFSLTRAMNTASTRALA